MKPLIWGRREAKYFFAQDWTTQISLKGLEKFRFTRERYCEVSSRRARRQAIDLPVGQRGVAFNRVKRLAKRPLSFLHRRRNTRSLSSGAYSRDPLAIAPYGLRHAVNIF